MIWFWIIAGSLILVALAGLLRPLSAARRDSDQEPKPPRRCFAGSSRRRDRAGAGRLTPKRPSGTHRDHPAHAGGGRSGRGAIAAAGGPRRQKRVADRRRDRHCRRAAGRGARGLFRRRSARGNRAQPGSRPGRAAGPAWRGRARRRGRTASRRNCNRRPAISRAGSCSAAPWPRSSRFPEALDAYNQAIALAPDSRAARRIRRGVGAASPGTVTPAAEAEFAKAPEDPRSRYYGAEAALQLATPPPPSGNCRLCWPTPRPKRRGGRPSPTGSPSFRRAPPTGRQPMRQRPPCPTRAGRSRRPIDVAGAAPGDDPRHGRAPRRSGSSSTPTTRPAGRGSPTPMTCWANRTRRRRRAPAKPDPGATSPAACGLHPRQRRQRRRRTRRAGSPRPPACRARTGRRLARRAQRGECAVSRQSRHCSRPISRRSPAASRDDRPSPELVAVATENQRPRQQGA